MQVLATDQESELVHELAYPVTLEVLLEAEGSREPVVGVAIEATTRLYAQDLDQRWNATSVNVGSAILDGVSPGSLFVELTRPDGAPLRYGPFEIASSPSRSVLVIDVREGRTVEVQVNDGAGQALPNRKILLSGNIEGSGYMNIKGSTNEAGLARVQHVPEGVWTIALLLEDGVFSCTELSRQVEVGEGEGPVQVELQPPGSTVVRGTVDADGPLLPGCKVLARSSDGSPNHGAFVRDGEFEIRGLTAGVYVVSISYWDVGSSTFLVGQAELAVGEGDGELSLELELKPARD